MISLRWFAVVLLALCVRFAPGAEADPVVFGKETLPPLPNGAFTVVAVPDTQSYRGRGCKATPDSTDPVTNENLAAQVEWILKHRDDQNIVFVSHVGDIVDRNTVDQWAVAKQQLDKLRGIVPFGLTVGNHDMTSKGDARLFQQHFPASSFREYPWYLGCYEHDEPIKAFRRITSTARRRSRREDGDSSLSISSAMRRTTCWLGRTI